MNKRKSKSKSTRTPRRPLPRTRVEMGHAGHFICGHECQFHRTTYANGFIISTIGEWAPPVVFEGDVARARRSSDPLSPLGAGTALYETLVFKAKAFPGTCCPFRQANGHEVEGTRHSTPEEAETYHEATVERYMRRK